MDEAAKDTIVLFETKESFAQNTKDVLDTLEWLKNERPEIQIKIVIVPNGVRSLSEN